MMLLRFTTPFASQPNIPSELQPRAAQCLIRLLDAMKGLLQLNDIISQPNTYPPTDYVFAIICKSHEVCNKLNLALQSDLPETPLISREPLFDYFTEQIEAFNIILGTLFQSPFRIVIANQDGHFTHNLVNTEPATRTSEKKTSEYLKEMSFVQDLTIEENAPGCDCPLCFDEVSAVNVVVTNCNHSFCGTCIKGYANANKDKTKKPNCPMCRTDLTELKIGNQQMYNDINQHILNL